MNDTYVPGELENCVLAVIWRIQPCTAYRVRREFQTSLTASWRASTGSIYPLLRKLVAHGLVFEAAVPGDPRRGRSLEISPTGIRSLESWLQDPAAWIAEPVADPIRTRSYVLQMLGDSDARQVIVGWLTATREALSAIDMRLAGYVAAGDEAQRRAHRGTQLQLAARIKWLEELLDKHPGRSEEPPHSS